MQISDDQIARVMKYLGAGDDVAPSSFRGPCRPDPRLVEEIRRHLGGMPDVREERVKQLRDNLENYQIASEHVAAKMIGRAISDQLR